MAVKNPIVIPYWVANAFKRKQLPLSNCLDYQKARQVLSLEDLAVLLNVQQLSTLEYLKRDYPTHLLSSWNKSANADSRNELDSSVIPLSHSKQLEERNLFRLSLDYVSSTNSRNDSIGLDHLPNQEVFELNDFERDSFALIVNPGFTDALGKYENKLALVKALLKVSYGYFDTHVVSSENIFSTYVGLLNDKVWGRVSA